MNVMVAIKVEGTPNNPRNVALLREINTIIEGMVLQPGEAITVDVTMKRESLFS